MLVSLGLYLITRVAPSLSSFPVRCTDDIVCSLTGCRLGLIDTNDGAM